MKSIGKDWYKKIWTMDILNESWVEDTKRQVDFIIDILQLQGTERILDLACGFGRHAIEFARRGYSVVGVDITSDYIHYASECAKKDDLDAVFVNADIRDVEFTNEFDVVLNMADGAIGYLENEEENNKIFDVISKALKKGGKHFMDIMNADYATNHFPCQLWDSGSKCLTLSRFEWDEKTKIMMYGQRDFCYGDVLDNPNIEEGNPTRLYGKQDVHYIMEQRGMYVVDCFADYTGKKNTPNDIQLLVYSQK